jgi:hypothetical protein
MVILTIFRQKYDSHTTLPTPPSISQHSNQCPVAGRVECGGWRVRSRANSLLFLSGPLAPHRSGHVPKTAGLYSAVTHHTRDSLLRPGSFNLDLIGRPLLVSGEV